MLHNTATWLQSPPPPSLGQRQGLEVAVGGRRGDLETPAAVAARAIVGGGEGTSAAIQHFVGHMWPMDHQLFSPELEKKRYSSFQELPFNGNTF